jgi:hypothetical protein
MEKRKKDKKKRHEKREKKNIYGKTKEHAKGLAHTSHVPHIFNLTLCGFPKVSRLEFCHRSYLTLLGSGSE